MIFHDCLKLEYRKNSSKCQKFKNYFLVKIYLKYAIFIVNTIQGSDNV